MLLLNVCLAERSDKAPKGIIHPRAVVYFWENLIQEKLISDLTVSSIGRVIIEVSIRHKRGQLTQQANLI